MNKRFAEIHGYAPEEMIERKAGVDIVGEDLLEADENVERRMSGQIKSIREEFRIKTKQGEIRNVENYGSLTMYQGRRAIIGTLLDVTERKQTEAMLNRKTTFSSWPRSIRRLMGSSSLTIREDIFSKTRGPSNCGYLGMSSMMGTTHSDSAKWSAWPTR